MRSGWDLDASGCNSAGRISVDKDLGAGRVAIYLRPGDVIVGALVELGIQLGLDVFLHLYAANIGIIALQAKHKIVLASSERQSNRGLAGLLGAVDEYVGAGWIAGDVQTFSQGFKREFLVRDAAFSYLQGGLHRLVAIFLYFQAVTIRREIVKAARRQALADHAARRTVQQSRGADDVGHDVNGAESWAGNRMTARARGCVRACACRCRLRRIVILNVVNQVDARRRVAQELE